MEFGGLYYPHAAFAGHQLAQFAIPRDSLTAQQPLPLPRIVTSGLQPDV